MPAARSSAVTDCSEFRVITGRSGVEELCTMVRAMLPSLPSMIRTQGTCSSSTFSARNVTVSKLASVSAEQPTKAA